MRRSHLNLFLNHRRNIKTSVMKVQLDSAVLKSRRLSQIAILIIKHRSMCLKHTSRDIGKGSSMLKLRRNDIDT